MGATSPRVDSVDVVRGTVMVVMALDHVRAFLGAQVNPEDVTTASTALFLTRWITHFCAPTFVFLAGVGAYLRGRTVRRSQLAWFLFTRGLWLLVLEFTLVNWGLTFSFAYRFVVGQVIWAIGAAMVLLSVLVYLPAWVVGLIGIAIIAGHNLFDGVRGAELGSWGWLWDILHTRGGFELLPGRRFYVAYPILPWFGVLAAGYGAGLILDLPAARQRRTLLILGSGLTCAFLVLRFLHAYGDPRPWSSQPDDIRTVLSFLNCQKYPPSLQFLLMTLGPALIFLASADQVPSALQRFLTTFGRVPLFFYLLHFYLIHALALLLGQPRPDNQGYSLPTIYLVWIGVVLALWPLCRWYGTVKRKHPGGFLSYL